MYKHFDIRMQAAHLLMTSTMAETSDATADTGAIGALVRDTSPKNSCSPKASTYSTSHMHYQSGEAVGGKREGVLQQWAKGGEGFATNLSSRN